MRYFIIGGFLSFLLFCISCKEDEMPTNNENSYQNGIFISNEGAFQTGTGTLSFYNRETGEVTSKIYQKSNEEEELGNILQSIAFTDNHAFLTVNNADKIVLVDAKTFEFQGLIDGIKFPRYCLPFSDNRIYVTAWGSGENNSQLHLIDTENYQILASDTLGNGYEKLLENGDDIIITASGGFYTDNRLIIVEKGTTNRRQIIETPQANPISLVQDKNNAIWVICKGYTDYSNPANNEPGVLAQYAGADYTLLKTIELPNGGDNLVIDHLGEYLFFTVEGKVFRQHIEEENWNANPLINKDLYSLAIDPATGNLLGADAKDYVSNGEIFIYNSENGAVLDSFPAGIIPGEFAFR